MSRQSDFDVRQFYVTSQEAARILGAHPITVTQMCQHGRLLAVKIANRWLIPRAAVMELAKTYVPRRGKPPKKRKYTKRSPRWFQKEAP